MPESEPGARSGTGSARFLRIVAAAVAVGALVRFAYLWNDVRFVVSGDGLCYHLQALLLADGQGFTSPFPGQLGTPLAHHPPVWFGLLALTTLFGARSVVAHQVVTMLVGLGVVVLCSLVGRRYFNERTGIAAAWIAALYPGFWVLEAQMLSEPLGLFLLGCLTLGLAGMREAPTLQRALAAGALLGLLAMVRSEQLALMGLVALAVLFAPGVSLARKAVLVAAPVLPVVLIVAPWTIFNSTRFAEPFLLSTNGGSTMLAGNCPPGTYTTDRIGYFDNRCDIRLNKHNPGLDRSQLDRLSYETARRNMREHRDEMPQVMVARLGRTLGVYEPAQTVQLTAEWMRSEQWPVWWWVVSYWFLLPMALAGAALSLRKGPALLALLLPLALSFAVTVVAYGEPRYHTPSDLGVIVLAAVLIDRLLPRRSVTPASVSEA